MAEQTNYICDLCGFSTSDKQAMIRHMASDHDLIDRVMISKVQQPDLLLTMVQSDGTQVQVNLEQWLTQQLNLLAVSLTRDDWRLVLDALSCCAEKPIYQNTITQLQKISQLIQMALEQDSSD